MKFTIKNVKGSNINSRHNDRKDAIGHINPNRLKIQVLSTSDIDVLSIQISEIEIDDVIANDHRNNYSETPVSWYAAKQFSDSLSNKLGKNVFLSTLLFHLNIKKKVDEIPGTLKKDPLPWGDPNKLGISPYPADDSGRLTVGSRKRSKILS